MSDKGKAAAALDALCASAGREPGSRQAFFRLLRRAELWVPLHSAATQGPSGEPFTLQQDATVVVPAYFSLESLQQALGDRGVASAVQPAETFLHAMAAAGQPVCLNAQRADRLLLLPEELNALLRTAIRQAPETALSGEGALQLSVVETPPAGLTEALSALLISEKTVRQAFLARVREAQEEDAHLLIGLDMTSEDPAVIEAVGSLACDLLDEDAIVDVCVLNPEERQIQHFFLHHAQPFYRRKLGSFLRDHLPSRTA